MFIQDIPKQEKDKHWSGSNESRRDDREPDPTGTFQQHAVHTAPILEVVLDIDWVSNIFSVLGERLDGILRETSRLHND